MRIFQNVTYSRQISCIFITPRIVNIISFKRCKNIANFICWLATTIFRHLCVCVCVCDVLLVLTCGELLGMRLPGPKAMKRHLVFSCSTSATIWYHFLWPVGVGRSTCGKIWHKLFNWARYLQSEGKKKERNFMPKRKLSNCLNTLKKNNINRW